MRPNISIIIPIYNVEQYIEECLQSVADQTMTDGVECILVDDCGKDNSASIAKQFIDSYHGNIKFRFVQREKNGGLSAARNSGIRVASGMYVYFLDSDDYLIAEAMESLWALAEKYEDVDLMPALYITDGKRYMSQFNEYSFPGFSDNQYLIKRSLLDYDCIPVTAHNRLIRRELIFNNNLWFKEGIIHEDNYWTFFLAKCVKRMVFCPEKLYYYRITPGSITNKINKEKEIFAFTTMVNDFSENIDTFYKGAQKKYIFLHLLTMKNNHYYSEKKEFKALINKFSSQCTFVERLLLFLIFNSKGYFQAKVINLLQRVFLSMK